MAHPTCTARRPRRRSSALHTLLLIAALGAGAGAGAGVLSPRSAQASPAGQKKHLEAIEALKESRFARARRLWREAYSLDREPKYLYNIAKMSVELEQFVEALAQYERFLKETRNKVKMRLQVERATKQVALLLSKIVILKVVITQDDVNVIVDERVIGTSPFEKEVRLSEGRHVVTATRKGYHGQTHTLTLAAGARPRLELTLSKIKTKVITRSSKMKYPLPRWLPWTALGVGLAIAGGGGGMLGWAAKLYADWDDSVTAGEARPQLERDADRFAKMGYGFLAGGGLLAVAGVVALFLNRPKLVPDDKGPAPRPKASPAVTITPLLSPTSVGLVVQF